MSNQHTQHDYSILASRRRWVVRDGNKRCVQEIDRATCEVLTWTDDPEEAALFDRAILASVIKRYPHFTTERVD